MPYTYAASTSNYLESAADATHYPTSFPYSLGGWILDRQWSLDAVPFNVGVNGSPQQRRIQFGMDSGAGAFAFITKNASTTTSTTVALPSGLVEGEWFFVFHKLLGNTNKPGHIVFNNKLYVSSDTPSSQTAQAIDQVTFGHLPFFGRVVPWDGLIGDFGFWNYDVDEGDILAMGCGKPLRDFKRGQIEVWESQHGPNKPNFATLNKIPLTKTGTLNWSEKLHPRKQVRESVAVRAPVAATTKQSNLTLLGVS